MIECCTYLRQRDMLADVSLAELVDLPEKSGADEVVLRRQGHAILCHDQGFYLEE
jgi:hypothetical protein